MVKSVDTVGKEFGWMTVSTLLPRVAGKPRRCISTCRCGTSKVVLVSSLVSGNTKSCGCYKHRQYGSWSQDISGQKFGRLTAVKKQSKGECKIAWECECSCGNHTTVAMDSLLRAKTKSCGCLRDETASLHHRKNLVGQVFGRLTAIQPFKKPSDPNVYWQCKCICGNLKTVRSTGLQSGQTRSCGCLKSDMDSGNLARCGPKDPRCLYLCEHPDHSFLYKVGVALPNRVRYREYSHAGGFTLLDYYTGISEEVLSMESWLLKKTREDLHIPNDFRDFKGKYELRKGSKILELYENIVSLSPTQNV